MNARAGRHAGAFVYSAVDVAVLLAPSVVLALTARKGGLPGTYGLDLLATSAVVAALHGGIAYFRLIDESRRSHRRTNVWIAAFDSLVVLGLGSTLLFVAVLGGFADEHDALVNRGWSVVWLWVGVQLGAIALAEVTGRLIFRWLERPVGGPDPPERPPAVPKLVAAAMHPLHHGSGGAGRTAAARPGDAPATARRPGHP